jgi:hypothetical protein
VSATNERPDGDAHTDEQFDPFRLSGDEAARAERFMEEVAEVYFESRFKYYEGLVGAGNA